jgi:SSS family solute:Na+ symporter
MLGAASIASKNLFVDYGIVKTDAAATFTTRVLVLVVALLAFGFWFFNQQTLVGLLLIAYTGMTQFFPGVVLSFAKVGRPNAAGVGAGIIVGIVTLAGFAIAKTSTLEGVNSGIVALALNVVVLFAVSALTGAYRRGPRPEPARAA